MNLPKPKQRLEFPKEWIRSPSAAPTMTIEESAKVLEQVVEGAKTADPVKVDEKTL